MQPITHIHLDHLDSLPDDPLLLKELMRLQQEACIHERLKHEAILDELKKQFEFDLQQKLDEQRKIQEKEHQAHIFELYEKILADRRRQFGVKSEIDTHQLWLFNEEEVVLEEVPQEEVSEETSATPSKAPAAAKKPRGKRAPLPAELPRIDIIHDVPEDQRICPCGTLMVEIGEEVSESLEIIPMQARVQRHIRKRYGCPHGDHPPVIAPPPAQVLPKSNATPSLLAALLVVKYVDGLPLARFEYVLGRSGIWIPRQTMARWVIDAAGALQPLVNLLRDVLLDHDVIHMDETPIQVLKEPGRSATSKSQMWIMRGGPPDQPVILFEYDPSRSQAVPLRLLEGWSGYLMTDGLKSYGAIAFSEGVTRLSCMTHARRYFVEAAKVLPKGTSGKAHQALAFFLSANAAT